MATACAHLLGGAFGVTRANVAMKSRRPEVYVAASLSAGARVRVLGPLHLEGAFEAQIPFVRPTYVTAVCPPTGFEPAFMALTFWLGVGMSIR